MLNIGHYRSSQIVAAASSLELNKMARVLHTVSLPGYHKINLASCSTRIPSTFLGSISILYLAGKGHKPDNFNLLGSLRLI